MRAAAKPKKRVGRPALSANEKARRATLRPSRIVKPTPRQVHAPDITPASSPRARPYVQLLTRYLAGVRDGSIVANKWIRLACERHELDLVRAQDPAWPYVWSEAHVIAVCRFVETLPHTEGQWTSVTIRLEPWQVFILGNLFGWRHRATPARRRFTTLYLEVGRKAAKSTLVAAIALYHLLHEGEIGAQVICGATTGSQARIAFGIAQRMVQRSPALRLAGLQAFAHAIITADGVMKPVNARASTQDGLNPSCIILDESHAQDFGLHDVLKSAQGSRLNPLLLCPTTAGYDLLSVGYALRTTVTKILSQTIEAEHVLGAIYTLDEGDDWRDERVWIKANPMLGITPRLDWVRQYCQDAQQTPGLEGEFRIKVCSQWLEAALAWLSPSDWEACTDVTLRLEDFIGQPCWIGGDLAQSDDIAAIAALFNRGAEVVAFVRCYLPRGVVERRARAVPEYRVWAQAGHLVLTEGNLIDVTRIEADIREWCARFTVKGIRFDQYGSAIPLANLAASGYPAAKLEKNAKTMTPPARDLEARVRYQLFRHDGNPVLKWMAGNTCVRRFINDSLLPQKESEMSPHKIDAIDAILQAMSAMLAPEEAPPTFQIYVLGR